MYEPIRPLQFVNTLSPRASLYVDAEGVECVLGSGAVPLYYLDDIDEGTRNDMYAAAQRETCMSGQAWPLFVGRLRAMLIEPDSADVLTPCADCAVIIDTESYLTTHVTLGGGEDVCGSCYENSYFMCEDCNEVRHNDAANVVFDDRWVCDGCCTDNYSWCDDCEVTYHHNNSSDHEHRRNDCECEAEQQHFSIRRPGGIDLSSDTEVLVSLPKGIISDEGLGSIARMLGNYGWQTWPSDQAARVTWFEVVNAVENGALGDEWSNDKGRFTRRLDRHAYSMGVKMPEHLLTEAGNIARTNSTGTDLAVTLTRSLNGDPGEFAHEGSCWWTDYSESRCALKSNGGMALRSWGTDRWGNTVCTGRAWVMPVKEAEAFHPMDGKKMRLVPTFDTQTPAGWIVFNTYGDLDGNTAARVMADLTGHGYRKIGFGSDPMYINAGGYLIGDSSILTEYAAPDDTFSREKYIGWNLDAHANLAYAERYEAEQPVQADPVVLVQPEPVTVQALSDLLDPPLSVATQDTLNDSMQTRLYAAFIDTTTTTTNGTITGSF